MSASRTDLEDHISPERAAYLAAAIQAANDARWPVPTHRELDTREVQPCSK